MTEDEIVYRPIGIIHSEHTVAEKTPIQPAFAQGCLGSVEVFPEYVEALRDIDGFSHIYLIYYFHRAGAAKLLVMPYLDDVWRGVFATRAPCRPNPIGLSIVRLVRRDKTVLHLDGMDILDGTPLLDIKPYTAKFDHVATLCNGWQDAVDKGKADQLGRRDYGQNTGNTPGE